MKSDLINANLSHFPKGELMGFPVLSSKHRIDPKTLHLGLYLYEIMSGKERENSKYLVRDAGADYEMTVISTLPLLPTGIDRMRLLPDDYSAEYAPDACLTVAEFEEAYGYR